MIDEQTFRDMHAQLFTEVRDMQAQTLSEVRDVKRQQDREWEHLAQVSAEDRQTIADAKRVIGIAGAVLALLVLLALVKIWAIDNRITALEAAVYRHSSREGMRDATAAGD